MSYVNSINYVNNMSYENKISYVNNMNYVNNMSYVKPYIKPYLRDIIINLQKSDTWKIQLTIAIKFISSKDTDNTEFMSYDNVNEVVNEIFESLLSRYQTGLMRGHDFIFESVQLLYCKCHKISFQRGGQILILQTR